LFDIQNGTIALPVLSVGLGTQGSAKIESAGNGWYRASLTCKINDVSTLAKVNYYLQETGLSFNASYLGDNVSGCYVYGTQIEALPYATSYIKTEGTTITRVADVVAKTGLSNYINSSEGTIFLYSNSITETPDEAFRFGLGADAENYISVGFTNSQTNKVKCVFVKGGVAIINNSFSVASITSYNKLAISFKNNNFRFFINGTKALEDLTLDTFFAENFLNSVRFNSRDGFGNLYGKTKEAQVFKTALTDAELITLTTL
jgi:hypothetical protein